MSARTYTLSAAAAATHVPDHPDRTAYRNVGGSASLNFDVMYRVWPSRGALLATIAMQERRAADSRDFWRAVIERPSKHRPDARCNCVACYQGGR